MSNFYDFKGDLQFQLEIEMRKMHFICNIIKISTLKPLPTPKLSCLTVNGLIT